MKEKKVKTAIVAMLLATAIVSPSNAGSWIKVERPCGSKCAAPQPARVMSPSECCAVGGVRFHEVGPQPSYVSRSQMVIESNIGGRTSTSVIDSTYRSYSR